MFEVFVRGFLAANLLLSVLIGIIFLLQFLFRNQFSAKYSYRFWFLLFPALLIPFVPVQLVSLSALFARLNTGGGLSSVFEGGALASRGKAGANVQDMLRDYSVDAQGMGLTWIYDLLFWVLIAGMAVMVTATVFSMYRVQRMRRASIGFDEEYKDVMDECRGICGVKYKVRLYGSPLLPGPVTAGLLHPFVILPVGFLENCTENQLKHVLLHELMHCKSGDMSVNYLTCLSRILYWFHPLVHLALKKMRTLREISCDASVMNVLHKEERSRYGHTLLLFADAGRMHCTAALNSMGGSRVMLRERVVKIASFRPESRRQHLKGLLCLFLAGSIVLSCMPFLSVSASVGNTASDIKTDGMKLEDMSKYFEGYAGSFVMYDSAKDQWIVSDREESLTRVSPNSTYKIYSALSALESGIISTDDNAMAWDKVSYPFDSWNQDQTLNLAMKNSVNWYFQALDNKQGLPALNSYFDRIGYGNQDLTGGIDNYWMESSLKISPAEQVELLSRLYRNDFGFSDKNIQAVKDAMYLSSSGDTKLYGKTGTGSRSGQDVNGWFVGFAQTPGHTYFFAANIQGDADASGSNAGKIALSILKEKGIYLPLQP